MTLFIDTHSETITIAILGDKEFIKQKTTNHEHSKYVLTMIKTILDENNIKKNDIKEIIVVNGPGSFTGIRIGVVIAKTLSYTLNIPIKTITSLEAFGISDSEYFDIIALPDTKGFYYLIRSGNIFKEPAYLNKEDFSAFTKDNNYKVSYNKNYDFDKILNYTKNINYTDSKNVNPIYIKRLNI